MHASAYSIRSDVMANGSCSIIDTPCSHSNVPSCCPAWRCVPFNSIWFILIAPYFIKNNELPASRIYHNQRKFLCQSSKNIKLLAQHNIYQNKTPEVHTSGVSFCEKPASTYFHRPCPANYLRHK